MKIFLIVGLIGMLTLGTTGIAMAQENAPQPRGPNQARPGIHGPRSIDQELDHLTKDLELTANQRKQVRPLLDEHHDKIQALFDSNPKLSRQDLGPQKQLEKAMRERMRNGEESRRPAPSAAPK
jgi:Spy/CpxP family protein refolding chaperone